MIEIDDGLKISGGAIAINLILALVKISTGVIGNSYALIADGIESTTDIFSSLIVMGGLRISSRPPDEDHPYGHGKAESLAGLIVALFLLGAAALIAVQSIQEIRTPHHVPEWYTLIVLGLIILVKEWLFRRMFAIGDNIESSALKNDAWHHRSDAITSLAAFIGISVALIGGEGYETADDWAALLACGFIVFNGLRLLRNALNEVMDAAAPDGIEAQIRRIACDVDGVVEIEKCRVRKSGLGYQMDLHVVVDGTISVQEGHLIGHAVKDRLIEATILVTDAIIHIEPDEYL
jgi:cation diffusion facilitator family transporter